MRKLGVVVTALVCLVLFASPALAQAEDMQGRFAIGAAGGLTMPMGCLADEDEANMKMGWDGGVALDYFLTNDIAIGADFGYGEMANEDDSNIKAKSMNYGVHGKYFIPTGGQAVPYLFAGFAMYNRKVEWSDVMGTGVNLDFSDSKPGVNGGVGFEYRVNEMFGVGANGAYHYTIGKFEPEIGGTEVELLEDWQYLAFNAAFTFYIMPAQ
jgi:hypothetical protein